MLPFLLAMLYPQVGIVLGFVGAVGGFLAIYLVPSITEMIRNKSMYNDLEYYRYL